MFPLRRSEGFVLIYFTYFDLKLKWHVPTCGMTAWGTHLVFLLQLWPALQNSLSLGSSQWSTRAPRSASSFLLMATFSCFIFLLPDLCYFLDFGSPLRVSSKCDFFHCRKWEVHKLPGRFHGTHGSCNSCLGWYTSDCHIASLQSILQNSQTLLSSWVNLQFLVTISITAIKTSGTGRKEN